jgi:small-conductance mechanosensitive channel
MRITRVGDPNPSPCPLSPRGRGISVVPRGTDLAPLSEVDGVFDYRLFRIGDTSVTVASLAVALLIVVGSYFLSRLAQRFVSNRLLSRTALSGGVRYMLGRFTGYLVLVLGSLAALQTIGVRATTLTAFGAALGVGIGFGLQDIVKNFVAGLIILLERPIQVGDRIEIDKITAQVAEIRARATVLRTNDDVHLIVPNAKFINDTIVNRSYGRPLYRCRAAVPVAYGSDPRAVEHTLIEAARHCEGVLAEPAPSVRFRSFGESALNFELLCWTDKMIHRPGALVSSLNFLIHEGLQTRGIELSPSRTEIHLRGAQRLFASLNEDEAIAQGMKPAKAPIREETR